MLWGLYLVAAALLLVWAALAAFALFADRSRGRPRCPKCFFSLEGLTASRCPECGGDVSDPRRLHRTRRRWGPAVLSTILLLPPALTLAGVGRIVQTGGWADLPDAVLVRLLWLNDEEHHEELIKRIRRGELTRAHLSIVVRDTIDDLVRENRLDRAYATLDAVSRNSYVYPNDLPGAIRPMLEEMHARATTDALLSRFKAGDVTERVRILGLLAHLRDADERANLTLLASLADADPDVAAAARVLGHSWRESETVHRLPAPPRMLSAYNRDGSGSTAGQTWIGARVAESAGEPAAILDLAKSLARSELAATHKTIDHSLAVATGLWLWCRLDPSNDAWTELERQAEHADPFVRESALRQAAVFPWSPRTEQILREGIADLDSRVQYAALDAAESFGLQARSLVPDVLAYVARPERGSSSALPEQFAAIGGEPHDLLDAILDRLREIRAQRESGQPSVRAYVGADFRRIVDIGLREAEGAELLRWFMDNHRTSIPTVSDAGGPILAYAALSGDRNGATRALLDRDPPLDQPLYVDSPQQILLELLDRGWADHALISEHYTDPARAAQAADLLNLLNNLSPDDLAPLEPLIDHFGKSDDPAAASIARTLKGKLP